MMNSQPITLNSATETTIIPVAEIIQYLKLSLSMPQILNGVANQKIIEQTAIKENLTLSEQELQTAADNFRFEHNLISSTATLNWLKQSHLSVTEFEELVKRTLVAQKLARHLFLDKVEAYFYANQLNYYQAVIYEIVLSNFDLAMELYYGIQEHELSFWNLAHEYITDRELRRQGGYRGKKTREQLPPEIAAAVFSQSADNIPQVLKPIAIGKKTHLVYVEEVTQPNLDESLRQKILDRLFESWLSQQRQQLTDNFQVTN